MMQKARGYLCFSNKEKKDVEYVFKNFRWDETKFKIFGKYELNGKIINDPGVFFVGWINKKYTSENVIRLLKRLMSVEMLSMNYSISIENENDIDCQNNFINIKEKYVCMFFENKTDIEKMAEIINNKKLYNFCVRDGVGSGHKDFVVDFFIENREDLVKILDNINQAGIKVVKTVFVQ